MKCDDPKPKSVDAYIASAPDYAKPFCVAFRRLVNETSPGLTEALKWGVPSWVGRKLVCGFAAFKEHVTFWIFRGKELKNRHPEFASLPDSAAMRGFKLKAGDKIPSTAIKRMLKAAVALDADGSADSKPRKRRPELRMPADLAKAINAVPSAAAFFETLPPSAKREFIEWVTEAKRPETREKRLAQSVTMLTEGRRRNEQYRK